MADVTYVDVRFSKTKREPLTSQESTEGVTYTNLNLSHHSGGTAPTVPPVCSFLSRALAALVAFLLAVVIALTILTLRCSTQIHLKTEMSHHICPTSSSASKRKLLTLEELKGYLCVELNESMCVICPYKWLSFRNRCYFISEQSESWDFSKEYCLTRESDLIIIDDKIETDFTEGKDISRSYFWIGLQYNNISSKWTWLNGSILHKGSIRMRSHKPGDDCGSYSSKEIYPQSCNYKNKWICEKEGLQFHKRFFSTN